MRRFFTLFSFFVALTLGAQTEAYHTALASYFQANGGTTFQELESSISELTSLAFQYTGLDSTGQDTHALAQKYVQTQFVDDMADIFTPYMYEQGVTETDLYELDSICRNPAYVLAMEHLSEVDLEKTTEKILTDKLMPAIMQIAMGQTPQKIRPSAPKTYVAAFHAFYESSDIKSSFDQMMSLYTSQLGESGVDQQVVNSLLKYMSQNLEPMMVDIFYGHLTEEDIAAISTANVHPAYPKVQKALQAVMGDMDTLGTSLMSKYSEWLKQQVGR